MSDDICEVYAVRYAIIRARRRRTTSAAIRTTCCSRSTISSG